MKKLKLLPLLLLCLLALAACGDQRDNQAQDEADPTAGVGDVNMGAYSLSLPDGYTLTETENGGADLTKDDAVVGGVQVIPYENASGVGFQTFSTDTDSLTGILPKLYPDAETYPDHSFESGMYGSFDLTVVPDTGSEIHHFFAQEDQFYDLWFLSDAVPSDDAETILSTFAFNET
jgi:hypothetical protein